MGELWIAQLSRLNHQRQNLEGESMQKIIRLGDSTSHGGKVVSATSHITVAGIPVARLGDKCTCPKLGHNNCVIVEGDSNWTVDGIPIALEGHKTSCGAVLISSAPNTGREDTPGGGFISMGAAGAAAGFSALAKKTEKVPAYDEQIQFISKDGQPYTNMVYKLNLADGSSVSGKTDVSGKTKRVKTDQPVAIKNAELYAPAVACCARHASETQTSEPAQVVTLSGVETNSTEIGQSVVKATPVDEDRPLTSGEVAMCKLIFKDSINYSLVRVHNHEYLPLGLQDDNIAMTPNGELYFNPSKFQEDFSSVEDDGNKIWFMHEMVHVWQFQLNYKVIWRGLKFAMSGAYNDKRTYEYDNPEDANKKALSDFNMEQQGELISHYYAAKFLQIPRYILKLEFLELVLKEFLGNSNNVKLLPKNYHSRMQDQKR